MIDTFQWPAPDGSGNLPLVAERTADGKPALYYANVYVENQQDLDFIDRSLMHRLYKPLFITEWPKRWTKECGTIPFEHDGVGQWIFVVLPGITYNKLIAGRYDTGLTQEARDSVPPILLRSIPTSVRTASNSLNLDLLAQSGFRYLNQQSLPSKEAVLDAALGSAGPGVYPSGLVALIGDIIEWVVEAVYDVVQEVVVALGTIQGIGAANTAITVDLDVLNTDTMFGDGVMRRAWGPRKGFDLVPQDTKVFVHMIRQSFLSLGIPLPTHYRSYFPEIGHTTLFIPMADWAHSADFQSICIEYGNNAAKLTGFLIPSQLCDGSFNDAEFGHFQQERANVTMEVKNWNMSVYTEISDAHRYMEQVVGDAPRQAYVTIGTSAWYVSFFNQAAWTPCFGYGDLFADVVTLLGASVAGPFAGLAAGYLTVLAQTDIAITDGWSAREHRGLGTHEYGHFIACHLTRRHGFSELDDLILTVDFMVESAGGLGPTDQSRIVNEAFADFFTAQIASSTRYFTFENGRSHDNGAISVKKPGIDSNIYEGAFSGYQGIGRLTTLLQDVFDGHPDRTLGPSNADGWEWDDVALEVQASKRTDGHTDMENVALGGEKISRFFHHLGNGINPYQIDRFESAVAALLTEEGKWCQKCLVMAPHFDDMSGKTAREHLDFCQDDAELSALVGPPPSDLEFVNPLTCDPCDAGTGWVEPDGEPDDDDGESDGGCKPCAVDVVVEANFPNDCGTVEVVQQELSLDPEDNCPETLVVSLENSPTGSAVLAKVSSSWTPSNPLACMLTKVVGTVDLENQPAATFSVPGQPVGGNTLSDCEWDDPMTTIQLNGQGGRFEVDVRPSASQAGSLGTAEIRFEAEESFCVVVK